MLAQLVAELVEEVDGFVDETVHLVGALVRVDGEEQAAVVDECTNHVLDVFFDVTKVHILNRLELSPAKIANSADMQVKPA